MQSGKTSNGISLPLVFSFLQSKETLMMKMIMMTHS